MSGHLISVGRKLFSGSILRLCNLVVAVASSFFLMPFIVHHLGDRVYGFWTLAGTFIGYYGLLDFGLSGAVSQYMSIAIGKRDQEECRSVFNAALRIQSFIGCIALLITAIIVAVTPWFAKTHADVVLFREVIAVLGVTVAITFPARAYGGLLEAELRFDLQSVLSMFFVTMRTGLSVVAILRGGGLLALAWVNLFSSLIQIALQTIIAKRQAAWARIGRGSIDRKLVRSFFSYSIYIFVTAIADILRFQVDALVVAGLLGLVAVTHYRIGTVFARYYNDIICSITGMLPPVLSRLYGAKDHKGLEKVFFFSTKVSLCFSLFVASGLIFWGRPFIVRWMGPRYEDAYWPLVALSLAVLLDVGQNPSICLLYATFKQRFYTYMNCAEGAINLAVSLMLARPLGLIGVALGTLVAAFIIRVVVQPYVVCRVSELDYLEYSKTIGSTILRCLAVLAIAIAPVLWKVQPDYLLLISSAVCSTVIYAIGSWLLVFSRDERQQLLTILKLKRSSHADLMPAETTTP